MEGGHMPHCRCRVHQEWICWCCTGFTPPGEVGFGAHVCSRPLPLSLCSLHSPEEVEAEAWAVGATVLD